jgi:phosphatidylinositol glycan class B
MPLRADFPFPSSSSQRPAIEPAGPRLVGLALLAASLVAGLMCRLWVARHDDGVFWPDEVYQSLEPAHRIVFGYGLVAWEFMKGARSYALPAGVAALMKLGVVLGGDSPRAYLSLVRDFFCVVGALTAWTVYRLARTLGASTLPAAAGACALALMNLGIVFGPRAMSETSSAPLILWGFAWALPREGARWMRWAGVALLAGAVFLRMQSGYYCVGLLVLLVAQGRRSDALEALGIFAVGALLFGLLDKLTWGGWFHSALEYLRFNVIEGKSGNFGRQPVPFYVRTLWNTLGPLLVALLAMNVMAFRRVWHVMAMPLLFVVIHSLIVHKELRFLYPALAFFCATGAVGLQALVDRGTAAVWLPAHGAVVAAAIVSAVGAPRLTFGRLGIYEPPPGVRRIVDDGGPEDRLLLAAHDRADLCGIFVSTRQLGWTGGYSYLHRNVPLYEGTQVTADGDTFNYLIAPLGSHAGDVIAQDGGLALLRVSHQGCRPDPRFDWHLN